MEQSHYYLHLLPRRRVAGLLFFFLLLLFLLTLLAFSSIAPSLSFLRLHRSIHGLLSLIPTSSLSVNPPPHPSSSAAAFCGADSPPKTELSNCSEPELSSLAAPSRAQAPNSSTLPFESVSSSPSPQLDDLPSSRPFPALRSDDLLSCDISVGEWALDGRHYPLYDAKYCPYVDEAFSCQENGRPDSDYLKWTWKPKGCDLPRLEARSFLEKLRGKRIVLAGDSLMRNQWESMLCLLREGLTDKSRIIEARGQKITKGKGAYAFKFLACAILIN